LSENAIKAAITHNEII